MLVSSTIPLNLSIPDKNIKKTKKKKKKKKKKRKKKKKKKNEEKRENRERERERERKRRKKKERKRYINANWQIPVPYCRKLHIPRTISHLPALDMSHAKKPYSANGV